MQELDVIVEAIRNASETVIRSDRTARTKQNSEGIYDIVTGADIASEKLIIDAIRSRFPDDSIISEETSPDASMSRRSWVIDPIDGTMNYSRGLPLFGIQAAFLVDGVPKAAAIYLPAYDEMLTATDEGAFLNGKPVRTSQPPPLKQCLMATGDFSRKSEAFRRAQAAVFSQCYDAVGRFKVFGAACTDFAFLACGRTDLHIRFTNKIWDFLPGLYIAEKAGAVYDRKLQEEKKILILCSSPEVLSEATEKILPTVLSAME